MSRLIKACPECDSSRIHYFSGGKMHLESEQGWMCKECKATFDTPHEREPRGHGSSGGSSLVARLLDADPDEVSAR